MLTGIEVAADARRHGPVGIPVVVASLRNRHAAEGRDAAVFNQLEVEGRARDTRRHRRHTRILTTLGDVHRVFKPLVGSRVADGRAAIALHEVDALAVGTVVHVAFAVAIGVVEGQTFTTHVEVFGLDNAGNGNGLAAVVRRALAVHLQRLLGRHVLLALCIGGDSRDVISALGAGSELKRIRSLGQRTD